MGRPDPLTPDQEYAALHDRITKLTAKHDEAIATLSATVAALQVKVIALEAKVEARTE